MGGEAELSTAPEAAGGEGAAGLVPEPAPAEAERGGAPPGREPRRTTRVSAAWTALAIGLVLLVVIVVFILENLQDVKVTFFGLHWRIPLALDLLLAAALGGAVVFTAGALRMLELRIRDRRRARKGRAGS